MPVDEKSRAEAGYGYLVLHADIVQDLMDVRVRTESRIDALTRPREKGGKGIPEELLVLTTIPRIEIASLRKYAHQIRKAENLATSDLKHKMSVHPFAKFIEARQGVGLKGMAMLLGILGDPLRFHSLPALYRYCGYDVNGGVAPRPRLGEKLSYNPKARSIIWTIIDSGIMQKDRYGWYYKEDYEAARAKYANAVHNQPCAFCTPEKTPPAPIGSPLEQRHKDYRARRLVAKLLLKHIWQEAHRLKESARSL